MAVLVRRAEVLGGSHHCWAPLSGLERAVGHTLCVLRLYVSHPSLRQDFRNVGPWPLERAEEGL